MYLSIRTALPVVAFAALLLAPACSTTRTGDDVKSINDAKTITAAEWARFAQQMKDSMVQNGVFERYRGTSGEPVVIAVGDFLNDTDQPDFSRTQQIMRNEITKTFVNAGIAEVNMDFAGTGGSVDTVIQKIHELEKSDVYDHSTTTELRKAQAPRLVLHGQFINNVFKEGRTTQYDYACAVKLIDVSKRTSVFEEQVIFPKQFTRGIFGR